MPKIFSEKDKDSIRQKLLDTGKELFGTYGLKKTSVADLTKAVGIALGTFYSFFPSKEELYYEILEQEHSIRDRLLQEASESKKPAGDTLKKLFKDSFEFVEGNPFIQKLYEGNNYELLLRKVPSEKLEEHLKGDTIAITKLIKSWQEKGHLIKADPEVISGLFRALFLLPLHKAEIGINIYPGVIELLIDALVDGLTADEGDKND